MLARTVIGKDEKGNDIKFEKLRYKMDGSKKRRKKLPDPSLHDSQIMYQHPNRWYMLIPFDKKVVKTKAPYKDVSLDPGTRTFQNIYSNDAGVAGSIDLENRGKILKKLYHKIKKCQRKRDKSTTHNMRKFWSKRYQMCWLKVKNKTTDLHAKTIRFLVDNFQEIRIGDMGAEFIKRNKIMKKHVKNDVSFLSPYKFRMRLLQHTTTRNISVVDEVYTSKTCCKCGVIKHKLKGEKVFECGSCGHTSDRDTNGAINIFIKDIIKSAT